MIGDLMYIDITTLEDDQVTVTASTSGFFINKYVIRLDKRNFLIQPATVHTYTYKLHVTAVM
jgi:hypothetical protein